MVLCICRASSASAARFTPGTVMWWPSRYTPSMPSVNSTRFRRSETVKMFFRLFVHSCSVAPPAAAIFSAAFPLNLCARTVSALPISPRASTFTGALAARHQPVLAQQLRRDDRAGVERSGRACRG